MKTVLCLTCNKQCHFCLDEWGRTPFHLHCDNCDINIGATSMNKCVELLQQYHQPHTYLEYYNNDVQLLFVNKNLVINKEIS